uniref:SecY-independent transporter protein n=1 Tax=Chattonella marina TaxID=90936 RepID=D2Z213_9STRA|nr:SecY-independent transporter protein [Chattonella marina]BAI70577.1 SecY-independent transporter protein [Chattonella marina]
MIFSQHFYELKFRLFYCIITLLSCWFIFYYYKYELLYLINLTNNQNGYFIFTNISEVFLVFIKTSLILSVFICLPYFLFQLKCFLCPCLYSYEYFKVSKLFYQLLIYLFFGNCWFFYFLFPWSWFFFIGFETTLQSNYISIYFENRLQDYLDFFIQFFFFFNCLSIFSLIIFNFFKKLLLSSNARKFIYLGGFVLGGLLTPPDVLTQFLIGLPILIIYEFTFFYFILKKNYFQL